MLAYHLPRIASGLTHSNRTSREPPWQREKINLQSCVTLKAPQDQLDREIERVKNLWMMRRQIGVTRPRLHELCQIGQLDRFPGRSGSAD